MGSLSEVPILSLILASPLLGLLVLLCLPKHRTRWLQTTAIAATLLPLLFSLWLYVDYNKTQGSESYPESYTWMDVPLNHETQEGVQAYRLVFDYSLAVDGLSLPLVLLTTLVTAMAALASIHIRKRWQSFYAWFLLLEFGMLGVFLARDLLLFFVFFELTLIPMFFLIGIWGYGNREKAANKFLLYNGVGSALMLIAFVILINMAGFRLEQTAEQVQFIYSGSYEVIQQNLSNPEAWVNLSPAQTNGMNPWHMSEGMSWTIFLLLLAAFGIKLPIFPFHTWMLKVHTEAPPSVVMIHSGILLKMGAYGLLRFGILLFPEQAREWAGVLAVLGVINVLYGAVLALVQKEFKLVLAYSSISHMGIVLLGIASLNEIGMGGAVFQLVSHGFVSALLFLVVGSLYERTGTTELQELGGLARSLPFLSGILLAAGMASLGLPGLSGFIGEFLSILGLFESMRWLGAAAVIGVIITAVYILRSVLGITFGPISERHSALKDARLIEAVPMIVLLAFIILLGIYPSILMDVIQLHMGDLYQDIIAGMGGGMNHGG
ncbi:NuoM family protein [Paenibacillus sp. GCM10023252]|uniref:complex I subunit 4 family protein n=1 Tax=Paenibacillus sp. GCM10023252 TaxID=3252649 RepID=UPI00361E59BF